MRRKRITAGVSLAWLTQSASASPGPIIASVICSLVPDLLELATALATLMFVYGGAKYAFSADDPGGRKQGKSIAINSLIGLIIVAASRALVMAISGDTICPGIP
ncbi:MAG: hypothetical protein V1744_00520 [Candidatus Altiarchaeota archaeon]